MILINILFWTLTQFKTWSKIEVLGQNNFPIIQSWDLSAIWTQGFQCFGKFNYYFLNFHTVILKAH